MRNDDKGPPVGSPLYMHLQNFSALKTSKNVAQFPQAAEFATELEEHLQDFHAISTRPMQYIQREKMVPQKTELQKKQDAHKLRVAVAENKISLVRDLLASCDDPNATNIHDHKTTLHLAAFFGHCTLVDILLNTPGIHQDALDKANHPPWCYSLFGNHVASLSLFLEHRSWVGPDTAHNNCLHGALTSNALESLMTLLLYPLDPLVPINPDDERLLLDDTLIQLPNDTLQDLCLVEIMRLCKQALQENDCRLLAKLWGAPFSFTLPSDVCEKISRHMPFAMARTLVKAFSPHEKEHVACLLAPHYARRHAINVQLLIEGVSDNQQTPHQLAVALGRSDFMQTLVHPERYLPLIHSLLCNVDQLAQRLEKNPYNGDPVVLFTQLFIYRLLD